MARPDNYDLGTLFDILNLLGRYVLEGKRDPKWVAKLIQERVIDRKEDGSLDLVDTCEVIDLGLVTVDYDLPVEEMLADIKDSFQVAETFWDAPRAYDGGAPNIHLAAIHYTFNSNSYTSGITLNDIRKLTDNRDYVPVQLPELAACLRAKGDILNEQNIRQLIALGLGVGSSGTTGNVPMVFEKIPILRKLLASDPYEIGTTHTFDAKVDGREWYLVRVRDHRI